MAKYYKRDGRLHIEYYVDGVRRRKSTGLEDTPQNRELVEHAILPQLDREIKSGNIYAKKIKTFSHYFKKFLAQMDSNRSYFNKLPQWNRLNREFGDREIDEITRLELKEYLLSLGIKNRSLSIYKSALIAIFELALDDSVISINPAVNIRFKSDNMIDIEYFSKDEVQLLISKATGAFRVYLMIAFHTGLRPQEILALQWGDISDTHITVKRARSRGKISEPKTKNAYRSVPYPKFIYEDIKALFNDSIYLFGEINDSTMFRNIWDKLLEECNIKKRRLYSTRHTYATHLLQSGIVTINELAGLLGHSSPKITLAHYASVIKPDAIYFGDDFDLFGHNSVTKRHTKHG